MESKKAELVKKHFCTSCGKDVSIIEDSVLFKCPSCGGDIARCGKCRIRSVEFVCPSCGFIGP